MAEIADVIAKLIERTGQGKVAWKPSAGEQTFLAVIGNTSVMVKREFSPPLLKILDKGGREIYELDTRHSKEWQADLTKLHVMARSFALNVDQQLDELLAELDKV